MSEPNPDNCLPSQQSASDTSSNAVNPELTSSIGESEKSENVKPAASKIAKPSALKLSVGANGAPPTRIGRLCNNVPKPAIPPNPGATGKTGAGGGEVGGAGTMSTSSIRRISDELARRRLTDVEEKDENTIPYYSNGNWPYDRKMSSGSVLSDSSRKSDEFRGKRSSDASSPADLYSDYWRSDGDPRRASDASVVLTEDTDQFIIGDRVWVGGVKPGQIAYIGETQFAPGEWAGIVLDEPIGKNDGTVANIRYFQCEPKKGIFSRLTRLTRFPLLEGGAGEPAPQRPPSAEGRRSDGSLLKSVPKKTSLVLTPPTTSKTSVSKPPSPDSSLHPNVQVGDRVIVKSSRGSKAGILRYLGTTDFAAGEWCGVELDDPLGKNDGSVSGTRYFECRPNFGLFAPLHKVSKSPANKRPSQGNCVIHNKGGSTTSAIRRQGSKESLVSLSSTASTAASIRSTNRKIGVRTPTTPTSAKNALQETLKEKELHIEQLLKERDLERAEVTRAASQADEAERKLVALKQEFEQQKEEAEARVSDLDAMVCLVKSENEELKNLLDDERKKFEDLQFRFEEETIDKADIKSMSAKYEEKIKMLEKTLFEERKRTEALEQDSNKLFEAEEQMVILKDELDSAKEEISEFKKAKSNLEQEHISLEAYLTSARAEIESLKIENESLKSSSEEQVKLRANSEQALRALDEYKKELETKQKEAVAQEQTSLEKEKELHAKYLKIMNDLTEKHNSEIGNLSKQLEDSQNNSAAKLKLLEGQVEEKMKLCNSLEIQLNELNILVSKTTAERTVERGKEKEVQEELQNHLKEATEEIVKKKEQLLVETEKSEKLLREKQKLEEEFAESRRLLAIANESADKVVSLNEDIKKQTEEIEKMKSEIEVKSQECKSLQEALALNKKGEAEQLLEMDKLITEKDLEVKKLKEEVLKQKEDYDSNNRKVKQLYEAQEESLKAKVKSLEDSEEAKRKEVEGLSRDLESTRNFLTERENQLTQEETKNRNLTEKVLLLEENYKKALKEKDETQLEASDTMRKVQSLEEKLLQTTNQKVKLEADMSSFINSSNDSSLQLARLNEDLRAKEKEMDILREGFSEKIRNLERTEQSLKQDLEKQEMEAKTFREELEKGKKDHQQEIEILRNKLEAAAVSISASEIDWKKKMEDAKRESDSIVKNLEERIKSMGEKEIEEKSKHEQYVKELLRAQGELEAKWKKAETVAAERENSLEKKIEELNTERTNLLKTADLLSGEKQAAEKVKKDAETFAVESEKLRKELEETMNKLATTVEELFREKEEKNRINEEKSKAEKVAGTKEELVKELQSKNRELEMKATSIESENKVLKDTINQLREEKCSLAKDETEKMMRLTELRSQLEALEYSKNTREALDDVKIRNLEQETAELRAKIQKAEAQHTAEISEKMKVIADMEGEIERTKRESSQMLSGKEKDAEAINAVVNQLRKDLEDSKFESERKKEEMGQTEKKFRQMEAELEAEKKKSEEYGKRLNASEAERIDLKERLGRDSKLAADGAELQKELAITKEKLSDAERKEKETANNARLEKETLEKMLETTTSLLSQRESEAEILKKEKANLVEGNKAVVEALQKERADLQKQLEDAKKIPEKAQTKEGDNQLQEEKDFQKGQVDFLNSVIVDMQKKNDALKARIEILEMGFSPEDVDEFNLHNITTRSVAPRLFCDICDRFDLHDTEDCPTQANEDVPPPKSSKAKVPPPERPYCDICEVFGHDTADCDDGETF